MNHVCSSVHARYLSIEDARRLQYLKKYLFETTVDFSSPRGRSYGACHVYSPSGINPHVVIWARYPDGNQRKDPDDLIHVAGEVARITCGRTVGAFNGANYNVFGVSIDKPIKRKMPDTKSMENTSDPFSADSEVGIWGGGYNIFSRVSLSESPVLGKVVSWAEEYTKLFGNVVMSASFFRVPIETYDQMLSIIGSRRLYCGEGIWHDKKISRRFSKAKQQQASSRHDMSG